MNPKNILDEKLSIGNFYQKLTAYRDKAKKKSKGKKGDIFRKVSDKLYPVKKDKELIKKVSKTVDSLNKNFDDIKSFYKKTYGIDIKLKDFNVDDFLKNT